MWGRDVQSFWAFLFPQHSLFSFSIIFQQTFLFSLFVCVCVFEALWCCVSHGGRPEPDAGAEPAHARVGAAGALSRRPDALGAHGARHRARAARTAASHSRSSASSRRRRASSGSTSLPSPLPHLPTPPPPPAAAAERAAATQTAPGPARQTPCCSSTARTPSPPPPHARARAAAARQPSPRTRGPTRHEHQHQQQQQQRLGRLGRRPRAHPAVAAARGTQRRQWRAHARSSSTTSR